MQQPPAPPKSEQVLGVRVDPVSKASAVDAVIVRALSGEPGAYVCLTNVYTTTEASRSPTLRAAVDEAFLSVPDGMPLVWMLRRRGHAHAEKVTGIEYLPLLARTGVPVGLRHFLYGGAPGVAERAAGRLGHVAPGVEVVGAVSPPFAEVDAWPIEDLQRELRTTKPHLLWVGLGAPKQELWMHRMAGSLDVPVMIGVGAGFDYLAGTKPHAPALLRNVGFEWLYRLAVEPRRLWRRYAFSNARFLQLLLRDAFGRRPDTRRMLRSSPQASESPQAASDEGT